MVPTGPRDGTNWAASAASSKEAGRFRAKREQVKNIVRKLTLQPGPGSGLDCLVCVKIWPGLSYICLDCIIFVGTNWAAGAASSKEAGTRTTASALSYLQMLYEKGIEFLSRREVYSTDSSILLVKNMLYSKPHCQQKIPFPKRLLSNVSAVE